MKQLLSKLWFWLALGFAVGAILVLALLRGGGPEPLRLDEFRVAVADGRVEQATIFDGADRIEGRLTSGEAFRVEYPAEFGDELTEELLASEVEVSTEGGESFLTGFLFEVLPTLLIIGVFLWFVLQMQGGGRSRGLARARTRKPSAGAGATFADVAGADEAVEELTEVTEFLRDPDRFRRLGARIPKGVLLYGPPGTGKTLLARATAGEAGAPFLTLSGSDFVEMFVGVGAARVRDLFRQAKQMAPAIIFVDEIDAVGRHRGAGIGGGHDEREQTLNQLLVEMDGFDTDANVIMMAATNRLDILDPALLRPGRFDRQIAVDLPDLRGREAILGIHALGKPLGPDVSLRSVARRTPGFTGADLANTVNEAALLAGRRGLESIGAAELSEAIDRVLAGPERRSLVMSDKEREVTAYHEAGHALVGHVLPTADPVHKISIVARGRALGFTRLLPAEDRYHRTRQELTDQLAVFMGGLAAEELVFDERTTGAADDIDRATELARAMVTEYGMSTTLGPQRLRGAQTPRPATGAPDPVSDDLAARVDAEVQALITEAHARARAVLTDHRSTLSVLAERLVAVETLDETELEELLAGVGP